MSSTATAPALNAAQQQEFEFDEETRLMEKRHLEVLESFAKFGFTFFCLVFLFLVIAWNTDLLKQRMTQQFFLTGYACVGFLSFLMAKTSIHRGMGFKIFVVLGVWMQLASVLSALTVDQWAGFQLFILAVTAIMVVLPVVFIHKLHRQDMDARRQKISEMLRQQSRRI